MGLCVFTVQNLGIYQGTLGLEPGVVAFTRQSWFKLNRYRGRIILLHGHEDLFKQPNHIFDIFALLWLEHGTLLTILNERLQTDLSLGMKYEYVNTRSTKAMLKDCSEHLHRIMKIKSWLIQKHPKEREA